MFTQNMKPSYQDTKWGVMLTVLRLCYFETLNIYITIQFNVFGLVFRFLDLDLWK